MGSSWPVPETHVVVADAGITLHERSEDPVQLTAVVPLKRGEPVYLRDYGDTFTKRDKFDEIVASPVGDMAVGIPDEFEDGYDHVVFLSRTGDDPIWIRTTERSSNTVTPFWSRDGRRVVMTTEQAGRSTGFVIVDALTKTVRRVPVPGMDRRAVVRWTPDGRSLAAHYGDGVRFYALDGRALRTLPGVGAFANAEDVFSPSGRLFVTYCPSDEDEACVWDVKTGKNVERVRVTLEDIFGWWDEEHLICAKEDPAARYPTYIALVELNGHTARIIADISAATWKKLPYLSYTPR
ncbi:hypothetical protein GCM10009555_107430 [Acrocarpospora macrocephala]|uniref:Uncharacterized protein n=2 Tax=Acrocarpospora macrocephala TaxID=150177 RepID=A0A5M3X8E2_9ACTN|nr:hypothetical protein Amac_105600 [Acrocarpospora macrocephala]